MISSLGYRTSAYIIDEAAWTFEFGGSATAIQIKENFIMIENNSYDLITFFNGNQFMGATSNLTSVGFGYYAVVGLEAMFEEGGNLEVNLKSKSRQYPTWEWRWSLSGKTLEFFFVCDLADSTSHRRFCKSFLLNGYRSQSQRLKSRQHQEY